MKHISTYLEKYKDIEKKARMMTTCPKCGSQKQAGEHSQIVCWGDCWRGENGLKYTQLETDHWLLENCPAGTFNS